MKYVTLIKGWISPHMHLGKKIGLHTVNNVSSPPLGGCPTPLRGRWWCCFHWPLQPMLGTWWQRYKNRGMDLLMGRGFSKSEWNIKTPRTPSRIIQNKAVRPEPKWKRSKDASYQHLPGGQTSLGIAYGNPVIVPRKTRKIGWDSSRDATTGCWRRLLRGVIQLGDGKGGSQLLSL